ncbi:class I lanthipeptide [uncultured Dokdonia sp.]|uniref:class I lanthipeptide n=1 Tax=uncultured Dokdonia sp. TaxID=575653 RepID=UPI00262E3A6D|nr:class I lanthipeptide [uncultured Dokdonia sp.]
MKKSLKALNLNKEVISKLKPSEMKHIHGASANNFGCRISKQYDCEITIDFFGSFNC